ncbi:MAG: tetratricopeptide repeat protein [Deltaproteobacteria bacterium]|nr:MAG: tetratricopeptide repeat protein [Deltaproteobacteria bacterium]
MAEPTRKLFVAREADLDVLKQHWTQARDGGLQVVHMTAPVGGGKRAMVGELSRFATEEDDDVLLWRVAVHDEEDGLQTLLRIYAGLYSALHRAGSLKGRVEMMLHSQIPQEPKRVQGWLNAFIEGLKKAAPKPGENQVQVTLPRDNPLLGLVEVASAITRRFPTILELQNVQNCQSLAVHAWLEAMMTECADSRMLMILGSEPLDDVARAWWSPALLDLLDRKGDALTRLELGPWGEAEVSRYLESKELEAAAPARIAEIAGGRPGFIAELVDWLEAEGKLGEDLADMTLGDVCDVTPDEDELDIPDEPPKEGQRPHAGPQDAEKVAYLSALLGLSFPSSLVADMGGYDRDSIDDLYDATEQTYKEVQFSKPLGTWIYQFHKALLRESVLARHTSEEDTELARRVAAFMQRYLVPRGYPYLVKTLRMWAEYGVPQNAALLRSAALTHDRPEVWGMVFDMTRYFDEIEWPDAMRKTIYMNLIDRMVSSGDVNQVENLIKDALEFAQQREDRPMTGWLLFAGSRLDHRRQDIYRARDRANDALKVFTALDDKLKQAEVRGHLAMIELADGSPNAALSQVEQAEKLAPVPPIQAHAEYVRGLATRRDRNKLQQAAEHFRKANEIAGQAGQAQLALEAGLNYGETLLISGQHSKAADVLARVVQITQALRNPVRERAATALLAQAHAALRNWEAALQHGGRTLELTRALKFDKLVAIDLYNLGFFNLMMGRATEAVSLFKQARELADATNVGFQKELLFNLGTALKQIGETAQAEQVLRDAIPAATQAKDLRKVMVANELVAEILQGRGDTEGARRHLQEALAAAETGGFKEDRKGLRRKLDQLA